MSDELVVWNCPSIPERSRRGGDYRSVKSDSYNTNEHPEPPQGGVSRTIEIKLKLIAANGSRHHN